MARITESGLGAPSIAHELTILGPQTETVSRFSTCLRRMQK